MSKLQDLIDKAAKQGFSLRKTNPYEILRFGNMPKKSDRYIARPNKFDGQNTYELFSTLGAVEAWLESLCSDCGNEMIKRDAEEMNDLQVWCGEWSDCPHCRASKLEPSPELLDHLASQQAA